MEHLGISVAQRPVTLHRGKNVTLLIRSVTSVTDRPICPVEWDGADRPTFGRPYPLSDRPDGPPPAHDRYPPPGNTVGRLSFAQGRPSRPYTRTRTYTRQRPMGRSGRTWDSAPRDGARTRPHAACGSPAARSAAEHPANAPTLPPAAPHRLRVPRARAAQAAADQAAAWQRLGRLRRRRSSASSRARLRAPLQLLRRGFLQPPLRPRERDDGFLEDHRLSTKSITVRQEHVDETSVYASAGGRAATSRARGLGGGGAEQALSS